MIKREPLYFEPRVVDEYGNIRWYGKTYTLESLVRETVYIRDTGSELYVYRIKEDDCKVNT